MRCEDAPCCGCCGPNGDNADQWYDGPDDTEVGDVDDSGCYDDGDNMTDAEADADTLASAGMGTDEDYGYYGNDEPDDPYSYED